MGGKVQSVLQIIEADPMKNDGCLVGERKGKKVPEPTSGHGKNHLFPCF